MPTPTTSTKTRLGEFFRARLDDPDIKFFQNNADTDSPPPYGVVTVTELKETTPQSNVFAAEVKIAVVTSIDMSSSEQHDALLEKVYGKLNDIPRRVVDTDNQIRLFGWVITGAETITKEESQSFSDVISITAGCGG
jgi:hypothetical protein